MTIPNRIVRTAHGTGLAGEDLFAYHEARARGGVGMSILQIAGVHATYPTPTMPILTDGVRWVYDELIARTRPHGMRLFQQLSHAGSEVPSLPGVRQWSSSAVPGFLVGTVPIAMTRTMIDEMIAGFAAAAKTAKESGIDGVEVHGGHGYLVHQFLSPALNHREDEYGGTLENRLRFLREILSAVRNAVGDHFPVGLRLAGDDGIPESFGPVEAQDIASEVEPLVDFIDLSLGSHWHFHKMLTSMESPVGYELPVNEPISRAISVPTIVTGRIMTLAHAEQLLASGAAQMVSMVRALIADPELVVKERSGRSTEVRPCTGTNQGCIGMFMHAGRIACAVNAFAGREAEMSEEMPRATGRVLIVGGGIAGLEVARLAALRGFEVDLYESRRDLGGQAQAAAGATARRDYGSIVGWLEGEVTRLGARVHRMATISADDIDAARPDITVLATGSIPEPAVRTMLHPAGSIPRSDLAHVLAVREVLTDPGALWRGGRVVVYDDTGTFDAITAALRVNEDGHEVQLVSRYPMFGAELPEPRATVTPSLEILARSGVELLTNYTLTAIEPETVRFENVLGGAPLTLEAQIVVLSTYPRPERTLADELERRGRMFDIVGDVTGTHDLMRTIYDAALLVRSW